MNPNSRSSQLPNYPITGTPNDPMTQSPNRLPVVFFGSSNYVIPIIETLRKNFDLKLVLTTERAEGAVPSYCERNKIDYLSVSNLSDPTISHTLLAISSSVAVLADFGLIIPQKILNAFPKGIINLHPSLLPKYRGPTPVQTAILNGDKITGVSIMKLDEQVDHGPILAQEKDEILDTDTAESLYKRLFSKGAHLLPAILNSYLKDSLKPVPQNHTEATFTKPLTRQSGFIDPNGPINPKTLSLMVRAYFPWPGVWFKTNLNGKEKILKLLPNPQATSPNVPITQQPNYPFLLQVEGKKPMSYKDFANGYSEAKNITQLF